MMEAEVWMGIGCGLVIGVVCGLWQARDMRRSATAGPRLSATVSAAVRLVLMMGALVAAWRLGGANKYWLAGSVAAAYTAVFGWTLKQAMAKKK